MGYDVFVSYSSQQRNFADALVHALEEAKIRCWIAPRDICGGESYPVAIARGLAETKITLFIASAESMKSPWCNNEITESISLKHIVVPCRIDDSQVDPGVKFVLSSSHWLDVFPAPEKSFDKIKRDVLYLLHRGPETTASPFQEKDSCSRTCVSGSVLADESNVGKLIMTVVRRTFDYGGRSSRTEYWSFVIASLAIIFLSLILDALIDWEEPYLMGMVSLLLAFPSVSLGIRRVRDSGLEPYWFALCLVPWIGFLVGVYFGIRPSRVDVRMMKR